jgi:hypothetical protein
MAYTVQDVYTKFYDRYTERDLQFLTGKKDFKKDTELDPSRVLSFNDENLTGSVAKKEGKSFINSIHDEKLQARIATASNVTLPNQQNSDSMSMDGSVWNIAKNKENNFG